MKKYFFLFMMILMVSCDNFFHEEEDDYIVINNKQEAIDIINGVYANLVKSYNENYFKALSRSDDINIYVNYSFPCGSGSESYDYTPCYDNIYNRFYKIIISINSILSQLTQEEYSDIIGELYFLRAYSYFVLARFFGNPYLVKDTDVNFLLYRPNYKQVYDFIEEDMLKALQLLPDTYSKARIPRETPHKGTAKALLAEIYLFWAGYPLFDNSKYPKAAQYSGDVIQNEEYYGFYLLDDFADLWKRNSKHNNECVFGLFFDSENNESQNLINFVYVYTVYKNYILPYRLQTDYKPEFKFYHSMPVNYRKSNSYTIDWTTYAYDGSKITIDPLKEPCRYLGVMASLKNIDTSNIVFGTVPYYPDHGTMDFDLTLYLHRYAQTLLTFAEARAHSGILDDSTYEAVNMIRRRANKLDPYSPSAFDLQKGLTSEQLCDSIVWERAWELCAEPNGRWFDIVRLDMKDKLTEYRFSNDFPYEVPAQYLQDNWYFYELPE